MDKLANLEETEFDFELNKEEIDFVLEQINYLLRFHPKIFVFLEKFFKSFPELNKKQFWITKHGLLFFLLQDLNKIPKSEETNYFLDVFHLYSIFPKDLIKECPEAKEEGRRI